MGLWKCSDSVTLLVSLFYFGTVPKVWHFCFSIGFWTCSESVALFVFLLDFGPVTTACLYLFFYWTLELFQQCGIICFSMGL